MKSPELRSVVSQLRTISSRGELVLESDAQLLQRFLDSKEELAFAEIVHRHGSMILRVGQRILRNDSDAEDIFQATFLLLARKADSIQKLDSLSSWLFGVAYRLSQRLRSQQNHRQQIEKKVVSKKIDNAEDSWDGNQELLLDSLADLPERYRKPLISCYLEGKTHEEVAKELQSPLGTVRSWIARGRELLRDQLTRRGVLLSVTGINTLLIVNSASATNTTIRATLSEPVVQASISFMGRMDVSHLVSSQALRLTQESFMFTKLHMALITVLGTIFVGLGLASNDSGGRKKEESPKDYKIVVKNDAKIVEVPDEPLPPRALARLGSTWLRHGHIIPGVAFSPDGKSLFSTGADYFTREWDAETGKPLRTFGDIDPEDHSKSFRPTRWGQSVAISPDGTFLAVGYKWSPIRVWNLKTGKLVGEINDANTIHQISISADGKRLALAWENGKLGYYNFETLKHPSLITDTSREKTNIAFIGHKRHLLTRSPKGDVCQIIDFANDFDHKDNAKKKDLAFKDNSAVIGSIASDLIFWGDTHGTIHVYDPTKEKEIRKFQVGNVPISHLALSPDGKHIAVAMVGSIRVFETETGKQVGKNLPNPHPIEALAVALGGKRVAQTKSNYICLWDVEKGEWIDPSIGHRGQINAICFSPDCKTLWTSGSDWIVRQWDTHKGNFLKRFDSDYSVRFSPDRTRIAYGSRNGHIHVVDAKSGEAMHDIEIGDKPLKAVAISPKEEWFSAVDNEGVFLLWNTAQKRIWVREELKEIPNDIRLQFSPDEKTLLALQPGKSIRIYDISTGKWRDSIDSSGKIFSATFSTDGQLLAMGSTDGKVHINEVVSGKLLHTFEGHPGYVISVGFSSDNRSLVVGSWRSAKVWEVSSGKLRTQFTNINGDVMSLDLSPDGRMLATGNGDGTVLLWDLVNPNGTANQKEVDITQSWNDLMNSDANKSFAALWSLAQKPDKTLPLIEKTVQPITPVKEETFQQLIRNLESNRFVLRESASAELIKLGGAVRPRLEKLLKQEPTEDFRTRIEEILKAMDGSSFSSERINRLRCLELLERIHTAEAKKYVEKLVAGDPDAEITIESKKILSRWASK